MKKLYVMLAGMLLLSTVAIAKPRVATDSTKYTDYFGKYKFEAGSPIDEAEIKLADTSLTISTSMGDATLDMLGADSFHMSYMDGILTFKRGDDKKVKSLHISVSGTELDGTKEAGATTFFFRKEELAGEKKAIAVK